jgi:hypothetical protein
MGFFEVVGPTGTRRGETFTCAHCNTVHEIVHGAPVAMCHREWKPVCAACHQKGTCTPFEKRLDQFERKLRERAQRDSIFKAAGIDGK